MTSIAKHRNSLPQLSGEFFMADGGLETTLIYHDKQDLPYFAAFDLLKTPAGEVVLKQYFESYAELAKKYRTGMILETATWRASQDWGKKLGYSPEELDQANKKAVSMLEKLREEYETPETQVVISGCIGPRGDGYVANNLMTVDEATTYHYEQVTTFANTAADLVTGMTMNYTEEATGLTLAAMKLKMPVIISFTVETDGKLPTGISLGEAIETVDKESAGYPSYYMINCAHPTHFNSILTGDEKWNSRVRGFRANASTLSHAELDEADELEIGDPIELAKLYAGLKKDQLNNLSVLGGCCGTDTRHVEQITSTCLPLLQTGRQM